MRTLTMRLLVALALVLSFPTAASAATAPAPTAFDTGTALVSLRSDDGRPSVSETPAARLRVDATAAHIVLPEDLPDVWEFLGDPGDVRYQLPGGGTPGLPSLGLAAATTAQSAHGELTVRIAGPGDVTAFTGGAGADDLTRIIDTAARDTSTIELAPGTLLRPTWIFTEPGTYTFQITPSVGDVSGQPAVYTVDLIAPPTPGESSTTPAPAETPTQATDGSAAPTVDVKATAASYLSGQAAEFRATPRNDTDLNIFQWQARRAGDGSYRTIKGNASDLHSFIASPKDDGARVRVRLLDTSGTAVSTSDPVHVVVAGELNTAEQAAMKAEPCFSADVPDDAITVNEGHFDFGVQVADGKLISRVKDDRADPPVWRHPASTIFRLDDTASVEVPDNSAFSFLGEPGATVWGIGQTQEDGIPWLGWNTQHASAISGIDGGTQWKLDSVDGPGELFVYQTGSFGSLSKVLGSGDGWPRSMTIPANVHAHGNWSFTEPGVYRVTTTHSAKLKAGDTVTSQETLTFLVGPCASAPAKPTDDVPAESLLADADLAADNRAGVTATPQTVQAGDNITITVPGADEGSWFMPVFYSTPQQTTWKPATAESMLMAVTVPNLARGAHKVAVHDAAGALVGWAPLTVTTAAPTPTAPDRTDDPTPDRADGPAPDGENVPGTGSGGGAAAAQVCLPSGGGSGGGGGSDGTGGGAAASPVSTGHFDFGAQIESGKLVPRVKDDRTQPPKWVDPSSLSFALGAKAEQKVPAGTAYSFLGSAGSTVWLIPQTQVDGVPWLGWNTQDESVRNQVKGSVTFTLDRVNGPGKLGVYLTDSFGGVGEKKFGNMAGFPSSFNVQLNVHAHGNWAFSAPGTYTVTMTQTAILTSGQKVSAPATLTFTVGGTSANTSSLRGDLTGSPGNALVAAALAPAPTASAPTASPTPAPGATATPEAAAAPTGGSTCILPSAGAPDILWMLSVGLLLLAAGVVVMTVSATSHHRSVA